MPRILLLCLVIVSLSAYGSSSTGLTIVPRAGGASGAAADDEPNNKRTTRTVAVGGSATGNIESSGDKDWFRVNLASTTKYRFDLESEAVDGAAALGDPRLVFRNLSADRLGVANYGGTGKNARLEYTVPAGGAGDYFLVAMGRRDTTGSYRLSVTAVNRTPVSAIAIGDEILKLGGAARVVDVSDNFSDPDGDTLTYSAEANSTIATARASNNTVTVTPVATGTTTVTVIATDPGNLSAEQVFSVTVLPQPNRKPILVGSINDQQLEVGKAAGTVEVSGKFSDPDGDTLSYEVESSNTAIVVASMLNSTVILTPVKGGTVTITVTAEDPDGLSAEQTFSASVSNRSPVAIGEIRDKDELWVGDVINVRAGNKFFDPDGDALTYEASISGDNLATINISGSMISFPIVAVGEATFRITAKDPSGGTATHEFSVTVPNRPPATNGSIPPQELTGTESKTIDVAGYFSDPDRHALTYEPTSSSTAVVTVGVSGSRVTITPVVKGTATITVTARDPLGATATQKFSVTVPNRPPTAVGQIEAQTLTTNSGTYRAPACWSGGCTSTLYVRTWVNFSVSVNVSNKFSDPDGDTLTYTATFSGSQPPVVYGNMVSIYGSNWFSGSVTVTARDPGGLTAIQTFEVKPPNRAPIRVGSIRNQSINQADFSTASVDVSGKFRDPDGDTLTYSARSSADNIATASASGSTVTIRAVRNGSAKITVTATDPGGLKATQIFTVRVSWEPLRCGDYYC